MKLLVTHQFEFQGEDYPAGAVIDVSDAVGQMLLSNVGHGFLRPLSVASAEPVVVAKVESTPPVAAPKVEPQPPVKDARPTWRKR